MAILFFAVGNLLGSFKGFSMATNRIERIIDHLIMLHEVDKAGEDGEDS